MPTSKAFSTNHDIPLAKERLPLPQLMQRLGLEAHARRSARCPFHEDRRSSFSIWNGEHGWRWKCHGACQAQGDEIDLLARVEGGSKGAAIRRYKELAGISPSAGHPLPPRLIVKATRVERHDREASGLSLPAGSTAGTVEDWRELAERRHLSPLTTARAASLGTLQFGTLFGLRCWVITDQRRLCAEARRMDGELFPAMGQLGERKAHTLKGSVKNWPVGLAVRGFALDDFRAMLAVEGAPDYLAALDFTLGAQGDCLPIAFLGAGTATHIHTEALPLLAGRRVRFYPHHETNRAGRKAARRWASQLKPIGCTYDAYNFAGLHRADGTAVKDLNDTSRLCTQDSPALERLLP